MKRIYTIGRDPQCDIVIQDMTGVVSRVHAVLKLESNGKMYIKDQSMNGTYINGIRVASNVEIPVSRKDIISFANIVDLDWSVIPNPMKKKILILSLSAIALAAAGVLAWAMMNRNNTSDISVPPPPAPLPGDTLKVERITIIDTIVKQVPSKPKTQEKPKTKPSAKETPKPKADSVQVTGAEIAL